MSVADTVVAIATAPGRGAVGVIRVSGPGVTGIMQALTKRVLIPRLASVVTFRDSVGGMIDHGIALYFPSPRSYTGEDVLELQGHGGPAVQRALLKRCLDLGARLAEPGEFTRRAFLNDKLDLAQAEAVADLIDASTEQAARAAARSLQGVFSSIVNELQRGLTDLRAHVEALLDFPEEDIEQLQRGKIHCQALELQAQVVETLRTTRYGSLLRDGVSIVLIGPPNSGKSTIINALSGDSVAIVSPFPGTTRDLIRQSVDLGGIPLHIVDTAGLRQTNDPIEEIGIGRTWEAITQADVAVIVLDPTSEADNSIDAVIPQLPEKLAVIYAHNKIDISGELEHSELVSGQDHVWLSAKYGAGVAGLCEAILRACGATNPGETVFVARTRHVLALEDCAARVAAAIAQVDQLELVAEELRLAQGALSQLTGEFVADDLLGEIFARFCIGK